MKMLFVLVYVLFLLFVFVAASFVVWHLLRYSLNQKQARLITIIFVVVLIILLFGSAFFFVNFPLTHCFLQIPILTSYD